MRVSRCGSADAVALVLDLQRNLLELVLVLFAVVRAEEELAGRQGDPDISLCATPITTVGGVQGGVLDNGGAHDGPLSSCVR